MAHLLKLNASNLRILAHYERNLQDGVKERKNLEIDATRTAQNYDLVSGQTGETARIGDLSKRLEARLAELTIQKRRANTVLAATWVVTLPAELKEAPQEKQREFFQHTVQFMKNRYGAANLMAAWVHNDETTPHVHMMFTPEERQKTLGADGKDVTDYNAFQGTGKLRAFSTINRTELPMFQKDLQSYVQRQMGMQLSILNGATKQRGRNASIAELKAESRQAAELGKQAGQGVQKAAQQWVAVGEQAAELAEHYSEAVADAKRQAERGGLLKSGWQKRLEALEKGQASVLAAQQTAEQAAATMTEAARLVPDWAQSGPALAVAALGFAANARREAADEKKRLKGWWQKRQQELSDREAALDKREDALDRRQADFGREVDLAAQAMLKREGDRLTAAQEATAKARSEQREAETARDGARSEAMQAERARKAANARQTLAEEGAAKAENTLADLRALATPAARLADSLGEALKHYGAVAVERSLSTMWQHARTAGGVRVSHVQAVQQTLVEHERRQQQAKAAELARQQAEEAKQRQQKPPERRQGRSRGPGMGR